jgi:isoleucyl-tRNA synthetase
VEREGSHAVALDLTVTDDLHAEGLAREVVHAVQNARKSAGLQVEDRIELALAGDERVIAAARAHRDYVAQETLAVELTFDGESRPSDWAPDHEEQALLEGLPLEIFLRRARPR